MQAKDVMTTNVISVSPDMSVRDAAAAMLKHGISGLPVVSAEGDLVGLVSEGDFLRQIQSPKERTRSWWLSMFQSSEDRAADYIKSHAKRVKDVMTAKVLSVGEDTDISEIAFILEKNRIKRVPVVKGKKVVGIVSRSNLLHGLAAQSDLQTPAAADKDLREAVMRQFEEAIPNAHLVNVAVKDGVVSIMGAVDSSEEKAAIDVAVENVQGIKAVENLVMI
ncbi:MAG: CBS domain-containing protein, partial [Beijerinckiaceae bacterium]